MSLKTLKLLSYLILAGLASSACLINLGGPQADRPEIPVSEDAADEIQATIKAAVDLASEGDAVTFGLSESQATSLLAIQLQGQEKPLLRNPQVYLDDGLAEIYGLAQSGFLAGNLHITLEIYADDDGKPAFKVKEADFGPLPLPDGLLDGISSVIDEAFTGRLGPLATGIRIEKINVDGGWMEITGYIR